MESTLSVDPTSPSVVTWTRLLAGTTKPLLALSSHVKSVSRIYFCHRAGLVMSASMTCVSSDVTSSIVSFVAQSTKTF